MPLERHLQTHFVPHGDAQFQYGALNVSLLITGVGLTATAFALGRTLASQRFDLAVNAGICGALDPKLPLGEVVLVVSEQFADLGAEEADGSFTDVFGLKLVDPDQVPFQHGLLLNEPGNFLPQVKGLSVNKVHGAAHSIAALRQRTDAQVESMEGAAFFYACLMAGIPFLEIRAVSNYVEPRNKSNWNIPLAIDRLNEVLISLLMELG